MELYVFNESFKNKRLEKRVPSVQRFQSFKSTVKLGTKVCRYSLEIFQTDLKTEINCLLAHCSIYHLFIVLFLSFITTASIFMHKIIFSWLSTGHNVEIFVSCRQKVKRFYYYTLLALVCIVWNIIHPLRPYSTP